MQIICRHAKDQQIRPLLGREIRWQPVVRKAPPLLSQTMPLIHSFRTIGLFDITFQHPTHSILSPSLTPPFITGGRLTAEEPSSCKLICTLKLEAPEPMSKRRSLYFYQMNCGFTLFFPPHVRFAFQSNSQRDKLYVVFNSLLAARLSVGPQGSVLPSCLYCTFS